MKENEENEIVENNEVKSESTATEYSDEKAEGVARGLVCSVAKVESADFKTDEVEDTDFKGAEVNIKRQKRGRIFSTKIIATMGVFVALLFAGAQIAFPLPFTPAPITLQTIVLMLLCVVLKPVPAILTTLVYVLMGAAGVPVFSRFQGTAALVGPTGGFIVGFIPAVVFMSITVNAVIKLNPKPVIKYVLLSVIVLIFTFIVYYFGLLWFVLFQQASFQTAFMLTTVPFLPGDFIKAVVVLVCFRAIVRLRK